MFRIHHGEKIRVLFKTVICLNVTMLFSFAFSIQDTVFATSTTNTATAKTPATSIAAETTSSQSIQASQAVSQQSSANNQTGQSSDQKQHSSFSQASSQDTNQSSTSSVTQSDGDNSAANTAANNQSAQNQAVQSVANGSEATQNEQQAITPQTSDLDQVTVTTQATKPSSDTKHFDKMSTLTKSNVNDISGTSGHQSVAKNLAYRVKNKPKNLRHVVGLPISDTVNSQPRSVKPFIISNSKSAKKHALPATKHSILSSILGHHDLPKLQQTQESSLTILGVLSFVLGALFLNLTDDKQI